MTKASDEEPVMTRTEAAAQWARAFLAARGGRAPSQDVYAAGERTGYRRSTLQHALKTSRDIVAVKEGWTWVWRLVTPEEARAVAAAHAVDTEAMEERWRDHTLPRRTVVTHWPCKGLSRVVTDTLDSTAPGGVVRRTNWIHSAPTGCNSQAPTEGEAA